MAPDGASEARPGIRPERDIDHRRLVLECEEDCAARGHGVLASYHQPGDLHLARSRVDELTGALHAQPVKRRPEQLHDLATRVERKDCVRVAQAFELRWRS